MIKIETAPPYEGLTPELILDAVESLGHRCDGRLLALNSYENRVYQIGLDEEAPLVAKFYRPGRWSDETILEEHAFTLELVRHELPVVPPLEHEKGGATLHEYGGFRFSVFTKEPGRTPELEDFETLRWMGRFMGRIHAVGRATPFAHRPELNVVTYGEDPLELLRSGNFLPPYLEESYFSLAEEVLRRVRIAYERAGSGITPVRLHGDCHPGNILWTDEGPHFVDFDDCRTGPAVQDLWMLLSGDRQTMQLQLNKVMEGYTQFCDFDAQELHLVEALRTLRMIHHSGWLANRQNDPAFVASFPWFNTDSYWEGQILGLREQAAVLDERPLEAVWLEL
jgi:Ser/Thr protein kinase RdoA (MazF antagonist)